MAIPLLTALLIHIIWLHWRYQHLNPKITTTVRAVTGVSSYVVTSVLLCLLYTNIEDIGDSENLFANRSNSGQALRVIASPANSACYVEIGERHDGAE